MANATQNGKTTIEGIVTSPNRGISNVIFPQPVNILLRTKWLEKNGEKNEEKDNKH